MTLSLDAAAVLQLAPDEPSAKAAKGLVIPAKWPRLEFDDEAIWGECQGSGGKPYQVQVDKSGPAFRCTCPSRKFPCKHGLALLLLLAQQPAHFKPATAPAWVGEWLATRRQRAEKQEQKQTEAPRSEADPQAAAKRAATRAARMNGGMDELSRWLSDRLRQGLAQLPAAPSQWDEIATRMVDAQLPGLAYRLRSIGADVGQNEHWPARVLGGMGSLFLLIDAYRRLETLPPATQADVQAALGQVVDRDTVLGHGEQISDDWQVQGVVCDEEERLWVRRVWLRGLRTGRWALLLDHAHGSPRFEPSWLVGSVAGTTLAFFPGNAPLRALVAGEIQPCQGTPPPAQGMEDALNALADAVAGNPWLSPLPMRIDDGVPWHDEQGWCLRAGARRLPLAVRERDGWQLVATTGGAPLGIFGEWNGLSLRPLSAWQPALTWIEERETA
ncbi:SWIM zinc finger family protein [Thauera sinica]|uniref:SWIM zinc finger family protein n=1 Tax=Thauera sinica TaxID=2665146 RepID=A0ABW1AWI5_9RHOO|nr:SWIM zinc finger family protein [Thauera sp. K11]